MVRRVSSEDEAAVPLFGGIEVSNPAASRCLCKKASLGGPGTHAKGRAASSPWRH